MKYLATILALALAGCNGSPEPAASAPTIPDGLTVWKDAPPSDPNAVPGRDVVKPRKHFFIGPEAPWTEPTK